MMDDAAYASVRRAADADLQTVSDILTEAFADDPLVRWLFPDEGERDRLQAHFASR